MSRRWLVLALTALTALAALTAGCTAAPAPPASPAEVDPCSGDLPPRTSPTDYPVAVLYAAGDDLPPIVDEVDWRGGEEPVATSAAVPPHLERFTVLQIQGESEVSLRMSDGVQIAAWTVDAIPANTFRTGDLETGRERWTEGDEVTGVVCVPVVAGSWAIVAELTFADDAGSGVYYWRLNVTDVPTGG